MPRPTHASASTSRSSATPPASLRAAEDVRDVVVHLAEMAAEVAADLGVLRRLAQRLEPELGRRELPAAQRGHPPRYREHPCRGIRLATDLLLDGLAEAQPHLVETREKERALRREVAVEHGLRDARLPRDLGRRGAPVAAGGEHAQSYLDDRRAGGRRRPAGDERRSCCVRRLRDRLWQVLCGRSRPRQAAPTSAMHAAT